MVACSPVTLEKIRAEVWLGDVLIAKTPYIMSFNVNKSRERITGTFSVQVKVKSDLVFPLGGRLIIKAGTKGNLKTIFTGIVRDSSPSPAFGMPGYMLLSLNGRGVTSVLENKKFSRRLKSDGQGMFCLIKSGPTNRPQRYYSLDKKVSQGNQVTPPTQSPNPAAKEGENSPFVVSSSPYSTEAGAAGSGDLSSMAGRPTGSPGSSGSGDGLGVHDHSDMDNGGPAFAVYDPGE